MTGGVYHPPGCRCPGCLPGQYVMRPASAPRQHAPVRDTPSALQPPRSGPGPVAWRVKLYGGMAVLFAMFWLFMIPYRLWWHTSTPGGGIEPSDATWIGYSVLILALALIVKLGIVLHSRSKERPAAQRPIPEPAACAHANAVPVDLSTGERAAWWCPDCETQLDAGFRASELSPDGTWPPLRKKPSSH